MEQLQFDRAANIVESIRRNRLLGLSIVALKVERLHELQILNGNQTILEEINSR